MSLFTGIISKNTDNVPSNVSTITAIRVRIPRFHGKPDDTTGKNYVADDKLPFARVMKPVNFVGTFNAPDFFNENELVSIEMLNDDPSDLLITGVIGNWAATTDDSEAESRAENLLGATRNIAGGVYTASNAMGGSTAGLITTNGWIARTSMPERNNKLYLNVDYGGYNIFEGNPERVSEGYFPGSAIPNCTGYAYGRFMEIGGITSCKLPSGNAGTWYDDAVRQGHYQCSTTTPHLGDVIVWVGGYGHVGIVDGIDESGNISVTACNYYISPAFDTFTLRKGAYDLSSLRFRGFIHNPYADRNFEKSTTKGNNALIATASAGMQAKSYGSTGETNPYIESFYGSKTASNSEWSAIFVSEVFKSSGASKSLNGGNKTSSASTMYNYHKKEGEIIKSGYKAGDVIFISTDGSSTPNRVGIASSDFKNSTNTITVIEGAVSTHRGDNLVSEVTHSNSVIVGAYRPK